MDGLSTQLEKDLGSCTTVEKELICSILNFITWDHPEATRYTDMRESMELSKPLFSRHIDILRSRGWVTTTTGTGLYENVLCLIATPKLLELSKILRSKKENDNPTEQKGETMGGTNMNEFNSPIMREIKKYFPFATSKIQRKYRSVIESLFRNYPEPITKRKLSDGSKADTNTISYCISELIKIGHVERVIVSGEKTVGNKYIKYVATKKLIDVYSSNGIVISEEIKIDESQLDESTRVENRLQEEFPNCGKAMLSSLKSIFEFIYLLYPKKITTKDLVISKLTSKGSVNYVLNLLYDRGYVTREGYDPSKKKNTDVQYTASSKLVGLYEPTNAGPIIQPIVEKGETSMLNDTNFKVRETITGEVKSTYFRYLNRIMCYICSRIPTNTYTERYFLHLLCLQDVIIEGKPLPKKYSDTPFRGMWYFSELKDQGYLNEVVDKQYQVTDKAIEIYKKYMSEKDSTDPDYVYHKTLPFIDFEYEWEFDSLLINFMLYLLGKNYPNSLTRKDIIHLLGNELLFTATRGMKLYTHLEEKGYITVTYGKGSTPHTYKATDKTLRCYGLDNPNTKKSQDTSIDNPTPVTPKGDNEMSVSAIKPVDAPSPTHKVSDTVQVNKSVITDEKPEVTLGGIDEKLNIILSRMDKMDTRIDDILGEISTVFKAVDNTNGRVAEVHQEIHQVGVRTTESMGVLSSIRMNLNIPTDQITGLRTDFRQLWEKLSTVDTKLNAFDNRLLYIDKHTEKIDTIMDSMTELVEKVDNLENVEEVPAPKTVFVRQPSQGGEIFDSKFSYIHTQLSSINTQMRILVDGVDQIKSNMIPKSMLSPMHTMEPIRPPQPFHNPFNYQPDMNIGGMPQVPHGPMSPFGVTPEMFDLSKKLQDALKHLHEDEFYNSLILNPSSTGNVKMESLNKKSGMEFNWLGSPRTGTIPHVNEVSMVEDIRVRLHKYMIDIYTSFINSGDREITCAVFVSYVNTDTPKVPREDGTFVLQEFRVNQFIHAPIVPILPDVDVRRIISNLIHSLNDRPMVPMMVLHQNGINVHHFAATHSIQGNVPGCLVLFTLEKV